jgi:hypothetical protein
MMDLDSFLVSLYVLVDDWWQQSRSSSPPHEPGRPPLLSESEALTLAVLAQWPRFRSERDFWRFARSHLRGYFPALPSQSQFNRRMRALEVERRWASGKRQIIEGVICQLKDFFGLERHRAKTFGGLLTRLAAKMAAYTCAQRINGTLGRPLRHLADLLV